jgi:hypothetical protein
MQGSACNGWKAPRILFKKLKLLSSRTIIPSASSRSVCDEAFFLIELLKKTRTYLFMSYRAIQRGELTQTLPLEGRRQNVNRA